MTEPTPADVAQAQRVVAQQIVRPLRVEIPREIADDLFSRIAHALAAARAEGVAAERARCVAFVETCEWPEFFPHARFPLTESHYKLLVGTLVCNIADALAREGE